MDDTLNSWKFEPHQIHQPYGTSYSCHEYNWAHSSKLIYQPLYIPLHAGSVHVIIYYLFSHHLHICINSLCGKCVSSEHKVFIICPIRNSDLKSVINVCKQINVHWIFNWWNHGIPIFLTSLVTISTRNSFAMPPIWNILINVWAISSYINRNQLTQCYMTQILTSFLLHSISFVLTILSIATISS